MQREPAVVHLVELCTPLSNASSCTGQQSRVSHGCSITLPIRVNTSRRSLCDMTACNSLHMLLKTTHYAAHCCPLLYKQSRLDVVASQKNKKEPASKLSTS